jgi:DNA-binding NtrC family response regulator
MIDFDEGCHGMTLLGAIDMLCANLPVVVVVTGSDTYHAASIAYANGATACLAKPLSVTELKMVLDDLSHTKLELAAA